MVPSSSPTNDGMKIWMDVEVFVMFYRRIVHGLKSPTPVVLACSWTCQGSRPLLFLPRILDATTTLRRGRTDGGLSPPASLGHAGACWCDFSSGEHTLGGSLGQSCKGEVGCLCCLCPVWTARHAETKACRQLRRDAGWGASAAAFGRGTSVQQPPPPIPAHIDADSPAPAPRGNWRLTPDRPRAACNLGNGH